MYFGREQEMIAIIEPEAFEIKAQGLNGHSAPHEVDDGTTSIDKKNDQLIQLEKDGEMIAMSLRDKNVLVFKVLDIESETGMVVLEDRGNRFPTDLEYIIREARITCPKYGDLLVIGSRPKKFDMRQGKKLEDWIK